ncbi:hypothetical protein Lac2_23220 [Claveliimonas bilis]|uniref:HTH-like domain-containing protein n=1 Tax=Claveliimonas bilis TaxID=3028070 RepID=UPI00292DEB06|nr:hypothetical protein [Claveliimonas bilis]BDZ84188.1 hypothetical protein Lac2_23220 [Claveliimonas bilis]
MENVFAELHNAYTNSAEGQKSCMICLVSIRNARKIIDSEISLRKLLEYSEVPIHYRKEVSLGLNLSKYVKEK